MGYTVSVFDCYEWPTGLVGRRGLNSELIVSTIAIIVGCPKDFDIGAAI